MNKSNKVINYLINLSFFLYFFILLGERLASVILSFANGVNIFSSAFNGFTYLIVFISILCWIVYLSLRCQDNIKAIFTLEEASSYKDICISSGILLLSGMVHTEYTTSVVQFVSYGILIVGILLRVILNHKESDNKVSLWLSFVYLVSFSMAIPVMYHSFIELHIFFHIVEAIAFISLVVFFTYMMILLFNKENNLFRLYVPLLFVIVLDTTLIILRWNEEINYFVLIFEILSVVVFIIGFVYNLVRTKKKQQE